MKSNGPNDAAFPRPCGRASSEEQNLEQDGLTVREWFAGQALKGMLASGQFSLKEVVTMNADLVARNAFILADAMIAQAAK